MDSKEGMSLKIHGTHSDQGEWREGEGGLALNIKLLTHTYILGGMGAGGCLLVTTGCVAPKRANWERHLLGLPIRFLLIQLSERCSVGLCSTLAKLFVLI